MLVIDDVSVHYKTKDGHKVKALESIHLEVHKGEVIALIGASGCGKSTLLNCVAGFIKPTHGQLMLDGQAIIKPGWDRGVVFQKDTLFPWKSVIDNVALGLVFQGIKTEIAHEQAQNLLDQVGLSAFANAAPYELSGGMRQRVGIARALVTNPNILLMDEPFGALDSFTREQMQELTLELWKKTHKTMILVTHSIEEAIMLGSKVVVMAANPGRIIKIFALKEMKEQSGYEDIKKLRTNTEFVNLKEELRELIQHSFSSYGNNTYAE